MQWGEVIAEHAERIAAHRDRAERQALRRDARAGAHRAGLALLLRRPRRQDRGRGHPARPADHLQLHAARAARRRRRDHAVELADLHRHACRSRRRSPPATRSCSSRRRSRRPRRSSSRGSPRRPAFPPGVINVVTGFRETGEALVDHPLVAKVSFTGSVGAGRAIAARAGAAARELHARARRQEPEHRVRRRRIWIRRRRACWRASSRRRGRRASPDRAPTSSEPIYDAFVERLVRTRASRSRSAIR